MLAFQTKSLPLPQFLSLDLVAVVQQAVGAFTDYRLSALESGRDWEATEIFHGMVLKDWGVGAVLGTKS